MSSSTTADLKNILHLRWKTATLAPFYIVWCSSNEDEDYLNQWTQDFIQQILNENEDRPSVNAQKVMEGGHSDFLIIAPREQSKEYVIEDFAPLFKFHQFRPMELKHKLAIVQHAELASRKELGNKLLKTLEEPQENTTMLFLCHGPPAFLPTIMSRAITLPLHSQKSQHKPISDELQEIIKTLEKEELPLHVLLSEVKGKTELQKEIVGYVLKQSGQHAESYILHNKVLEHYHWFELSRRYHNPEAERILPFLKALTYFHSQERRP